MTGAGWADRARVVATFALAGPPTGLMGMVAAAALSPGGYPPGGLGSWLQALPVMLLFAFILGEAPALATGLVAAALAPWADRPWRFAVANAAAGFAVTAALSLLLRPLPTAVDGAWSGAWRLGCVGAFAGAACAAIASFRHGRRSARGAAAPALG